MDVLPVVCLLYTTRSCWLSMCFYSCLLLCLCSRCCVFSWSSPLSTPTRVLVLSLFVAKFFARYINYLNFGTLILFLSKPVWTRMIGESSRHQYSCYDQRALTGSLASLAIAFSFASSNFEIGQRLWPNQQALTGSLASIAFSHRSHIARLLVHSRLVNIWNRAAQLWPNEYALTSSLNSLTLHLCNFDWCLPIILLYVCPSENPTTINYNCLLFC